MKKLVGIAAVVMTAVSVVPNATAGPPKQQKVSGSVAISAPYTDNSGCYAGLHRRTAILTQEMVNGGLGYHFDIDPVTLGKPFVLEPTGGQGHVDLDIYFYTKFGTVEDVAGDPLNAGAPATVQFNTREAGGESGIVPKGDWTKVIVCMYGGDQGAGAGATFDYVAGKGVKLP
jgi:hypothetical protein